MKDILLQMAEKADDGIIYVKADGIIAYWNIGCEHIFGFGSVEAVGTSLDLIIPVKHRQRHWDSFDQVLKTGKTAYAGKMMKAPAVKKDGSKLIIEFSVQVITQMGENIGFTSIIRDATPK